MRSIRCSNLLKKVYLMNNDRATSLLREHLDQVSEMREHDVDNPAFLKWCRDTEVTIEKVFGSLGRHLGDFVNISFSPFAYATGVDERRVYLSGLDNAESVLKSFIDEIEKFGLDKPEMCSLSLPAMESIFNMCERFHLVARQLRDRHDGRETIDIEDEYDVQDLFNSLLRLYFDDIRPEEYTPSYAGKNSRVDFLIKQERIFIEIKKTRKGLTDKEVGEQLLIDIARYADHPDCEQLVCFVYDPDGRMNNAAGLINDIELKNDWVKVIIKPE